MPGDVPGILWYTIIGQTTSIYKNERSRNAQTLLIG